MKQLILIGMILGTFMPGLRAEGPPQPPRPPVAKDESKEEPKVATGERIEIPDVGFSIVPPNGWMVDKNAHGSSLLFEAPKQPNQIYQPTIQVMVFSKHRYIDEVTMKEYGDFIIEKFGQMSNRVTGYRLRDAAIQRLETGDPSILYYTEFQYDDVPIMQMHILISSATNHFVMTYTDVAKVFEDESSPGLAIAYTSMHSAQLDSRPPWRWRSFVIGGAAVFLVTLGWFTLRFMRARRMVKLSQRIEDEDDKEITRDEESQYYRRQSRAWHADSHVGDDKSTTSKRRSKAATKVSQVQSSHFDEDDEPEVSDVVPISTMEKSLRPVRKRRPEAASAASRHPAPPQVSQQPVAQHQQMQGMNASPVPPPQAHPGHAMHASQPMHPGMPAQGMNSSQPMHPGMPAHAVNPQGIQEVNPSQPPYPGMPANGMNPNQAMHPGMPAQAMAAQVNSAMPQHAQHNNPSAFPQNAAGQAPHAMMPPPSAHVQQQGYPHSAPGPIYPQEQEAVSQHPFAAPVASQAAMPAAAPIPEAVMPVASHIGQDQATTASLMPNVHAQPPATEQPAYAQEAAAPAAQAYAAPAAPSFAASTPTTVSVMPQFAPPAESVSEPPVTASRPQANQMSRKQPLNQNDDDEPEMTEEARLSEILPKAGTIEKSKPKRKGLFWRKKAEDDDDQNDGTEDKASWNMPAAKKSKGKSEDEDNDNDGDADEWAVAAGGDSPAVPAEKDHDESLETDASAPEATKKSDPKRDSLLNETQRPQRLVRGTPKGSVTKEQYNAAVTEDGWNLSSEDASDHGEEDEEEVG